MRNVVVFDVGGTKITATVINELGLDLLGDNPVRVPTPLSDPPDKFIDQLANTVRQLDEQFHDVVAWGAAFPGPYSAGPNGQLIVHPRNIPRMRGVNVEAAMRTQLDMHGYVDNDLKLALWGEYLRGAAQGHNSVLGLVHSTGINSAAIINGEMFRGPDNNAGEIGCLKVEANPSLARPCDVDDNHDLGHLEAQIRGPALAEIFLGADRRNPDDVRAKLEMATPAQRAEMIEYCVPYVVSALGPIAEFVRPSLLVLHGGVAGLLGRNYAAELDKQLKSVSEAFSQQGRVCLADDLSGSPLFGAADFAFDQVGVAMGIPARNSALVPPAL
jgi:predicted NBD/HSP70 family sugar kinase